jgi:4-hydroxybenzoate polyprenyltransferase
MVDITVEYTPAECAIRRIPAIVLSCIKEARPSVLAIQLIRFTAGAALAARITGHWLPLRAGVGALSWELAIVWTYLFNGAMDIEEDRVNGSQRPIATGALTRSMAIGCAQAAAALSLAGASLLGLPTACTVLAMLLIGWQYSASPGRLKARPVGTAAAGAALGFLAYLAGFLGQTGSAGRYPTADALIFALVMSAWMAFVGTPAKDLPDAQGDAAAGRKTLVLLWGENGTRRALSAAAMTIAIAFAAAAAISGPLLRWPAAAMAAGALTIALASLSQVSAGDRSRRRRPYRIFMVTQYLVNICLLMLLI